MPERYALRAGEMLAISSDAIRRDADGFFLVGDETPENEVRGTVQIVSIRGALQQFNSWAGDSYESIEARVGKAMGADPKPSAVLLCISSPGGVVAGLNECVLRLQRMSKQHKVPLIAYANELAASAAYALCCACSEILAPPSGIVGSVGVISTMVSLAARDEKDGIAFRIITSGKRKADGHVHVPISDDAVRAEQSRNADMAAQFFALAGKARKVAPAKLQALEAAIYMGKRAKAVGLVDDVMSLDDVLLGLDATIVPTQSGAAPNEGNVTDRRAEPSKTAQSGAPLDTSRPSMSLLKHPVGGDMSVKLSALIKKTEAAIAAETDPRKVRSLQASLAAYNLASADMDGDDDGDDDGDGDEDESKSKKAAESARKAKAKAESAKHRAKAAEHKQKAAEYEEAAKKAEEESSSEEDDEEEAEEEEARLRTPSPSALTGAAAEILASQAGTAAEALARVEALERRAQERDRQSMIAKLVAERRVTPGEAKKWAKKPGAFWSQVEEMRPHALINISDDAALTPDADATNADIPAAAKKYTEQAILAAGLTGDKAEAFRKAAYADHRAAMSKTNGAGVY